MFHAPGTCSIRPRIDSMSHTACSIDDEQTVQSTEHVLGMSHAPSNMFNELESILRGSKDMSCEPYKIFYELYNVFYGPYNISYLVLGQYNMLSGCYGA